MQVHKAGLVLPSASLSDYPNAAAFAEFDHVYMVTAAFTDEPLGASP